MKEEHDLRQVCRVIREKLDQVSEADLQAEKIKDDLDNILKKIESDEEVKQSAS